jgi:Tfp pilus assembly protein PilF
MIPRTLRYLTLLSCVLLAATAHAQPATTTGAAAPADPAQPLIDEAITSLQNHNMDGAMIKLDGAIKQNPHSKTALVLRGCVYGTKKLWNQAEADFDAAALVAPNDPQIKFLRADVKFSAKDYETARDRYSELVHDPDKGDLASFQVFLCDLALGRHDDAKKEFDAFNAAGENPSYY